MQILGCFLLCVEESDGVVIDIGDWCYSGGWSAHVIIIQSTQTFGTCQLLTIIW